MQAARGSKKTNEDESKQKSDAAPMGTGDVLNRPRQTAQAAAPAYHGQYYNKGSPAEVKQPFLCNLFGILSTTSEYEDILRWLPDGNGFIIIDKSRFEKETLPMVLPNTKYDSFRRRLKRLKFAR